MMASYAAVGSLRAKRGFEGLYREHVGDVYRYALAVTGNTSDAEDVTQTTFLNAFRAFERGERPLKPQNWLMTIAHNVCRQRVRHSATRPREVAYDDGLTQAAAAADDVPTAADIKRALAHLPYMQRATLIMRELEGRPHAEIAEVLGLTVQATEMLAFRARRALREHLAGSLTCTQAEGALDRQSDGTLAAEDTALLRAHLRECADCERLARRLRAQRSAWKALGAVSVPASLQTFGGGVSAVGAGLGAGAAVKVASVVLAAATVGGGALVAKRELVTKDRPAAPPVRHVLTKAPRHVSHSKGPARTVHMRPRTQPQRVVPQSASAVEKRAQHPDHPAKRPHVRPVHSNNGVRRRPHGLPAKRGHGRVSDRRAGSRVGRARPQLHPSFEGKRSRVERTP
jgi:RNA polymerase sigma factor (sigma-70 family)